MPKPLLVILLIACCVSGFAQPQSYTQRPALALHTTFHDFKGADSLKSFGRNMKTGLALSYQNNISRRLDLIITFGGSFLNFPARKGHNQGSAKEQLYLESTVGVRAKLLPATYRVLPFVQAGAGISQFNNYYGVFIPMGAGAQVNISQDVFLLLNSQYRLPLTNTQNNHFYHSIGLAGVIGKKKIIQQKLLPQFPQTTVIAKDSDGDGIVDSADACPQIPGSVKYQGCPVPDKDGDGINDEHDKCPDVPGLIFLQGCPMPDRDKDGIADEQDQCPDIPAPRTITGCPAIADSILNRIDKAARHIFFETGRYTLLRTSYAALDVVVTIMQNDSYLQLVIEGHTDNVGTPENNKSLSNSRAKAVSDYLVEKGIAVERLRSTGYGQDKPVASNQSAAGRATNRRVALILFYTTGNSTH